MYSAINIENHQKVAIKMEKITLTTKKKKQHIALEDLSINTEYHLYTKLKDIGMYFDDVTKCLVALY